METFLQIPVDRHGMQASMLGYFLLAILELLRGLANLTDGSQRGKCGGVAGLTRLEPV